LTDLAEPRVLVIDDGGHDGRGSSFPVPAACLDFIGRLQDLHIASIRPGHVRGNHYHVARKELILVVAGDQWSLYFDTGEGTAVSVHPFGGHDAVAIEIPPRCGHALRNDGKVPLWLFAATDGPYDPAEPDAYTRRVVAF
jgi:dTDP-4-dehydrorhamnose 3,5-epimerase-like enzyme